MRRVTRELPVYELVIAKSGAKVSPYTGHDCVMRDDAAWPPPALPEGQRYCGDQARIDGDRLIREGVMTLDDTLGDFAANNRMLSGDIDELARSARRAIAKILSQPAWNVGHARSSFL